MRLCRFDRAYLAFLALTVAVWGLDLGCGQRSSFRQERRYYLTSHLSSAELSSPSNQAPAAPLVELGFDRRQSLFLSPPSVLRFAGVPSGPGATARFAPALMPAAHAAGSDGATFVMRCTDAKDRWTELYREDVPPSRAQARAPRWREREVSLAPCSEITSTLELETTCGAQANCAADWALWGAPVIEYGSALRVRPRKLVLLISVDTLRPERLRLYGAERPTSPSLERLAEHGIVFEQAVAPSPWTIPSHASLLTSTYPRVHGADADHALRERIPSLATVFARARWQTAGFVDSPYLNRKFGFDRGFAHFDDEPAPPGDFRRGAPVVLERIVDWLSRADGRPAFVFWHVMDVHGPYGAATPFGGRFRHALRRAEDDTDADLSRLRAMKYHDYLKLDRYRSVEDLIASYDEGVAELDATLGRLFDFLERAGLWDESLIVVTSDHGESFLDRGPWVGHGLFLGDDEIRVPLVVKLPNDRHAGERVSRLVGLVDVAPSLLELSGVETPPSFQGESLFATTGQETRRSPLFGFSSHVGASYVRTDELHFVGPASKTSESLSQSLFRTSTSLPIELEPLLDTQAYAVSRGRLEPIEATEEIAERANRWLAGHLEDVERLRTGSGGFESPTLEPEELDRLRALGYVDEPGKRK